MKLRTLALILACWPLVQCQSVWAEPLGTAFTYQGRLHDQGAPANGLYDLRFILYSAEFGGSQVGEVLTNAPVAVANGLFTATLDFGSTAFDGTAYWLEVAVRTNNSTMSFIPLHPRQRLMPVPYALHALNAGFAAQAANASNALTATSVPWTGITGVPVGFSNTTYTAGLGLSLSLANEFSVVFDGSGMSNAAARSDHTHSAVDLVSGVLADERLSSNVALLSAPQLFTGSNTFAGVSILTNEANLFAGSFQGDGSGLSNLMAATLTGIVPDTRLSSNVALLNTHATFSGSVTATGSFQGDGSGLSNINSASLTGLLTVQKTPYNIGHINDGGSARSVAMAGTYAYLANETDGLRIYDISKPDAPLNVGHTNDGGSAWGVTVVSNYLYLANQQDGLRIYDVSDPAHPINIGHANNGGAAHGVAVVGNLLYLANGSDGLRVYDVSDPPKPINVGHTNSGGNALAVAVSGQYAYLANDADGVRVYDISNPTHPVEVGHKTSTGMAKSIAVVGGYTYLANGDDGLRISVSNATNLSTAVHIDNGGEAWSVAVAGHFAYLANSDDGVRIYDLPYLYPVGFIYLNRPVLAGHVTNGCCAYGVAVKDGLLCLANGADGLRLYVLGSGVALNAAGGEPLELNVSNQRALRLEPTTNSPNVVGGWSENVVRAGVVGATISGGGTLYAQVFDLAFTNQFNSIHAHFGTVGGGFGNSISEDADLSTISGGASNTIWATSGVNTGCTITGGMGNRIGDAINHATFNTIGGGQGNHILGDDACTIGGGRGNSISQQTLRGTISGGSDNSLDGSFSTIGGGHGNRIRFFSIGSTISGGISNVMDQGLVDYCTIGGGLGNAIQTSAFGSTLSGGISNNIRRTVVGATISGGSRNSIYDRGGISTISGGSDNTVFDYANVIGGGQSNVVHTNATHATIGGGQSNAIQSHAAFSTVSGGFANLAGGTNTTIGGGAANAANGGASTVCGGIANVADAGGSAVGGGLGNFISSPYATVGGGFGNRIFLSCEGATIGGGHLNLVHTDSAYVTIGGGLGNTVSPDGSARSATIPGGESNVVGGAFCLAAGRRAKSIHPGSLVWGDSTDTNISSTNANSWTVRASGGVRFFSDSGATMGVILNAGEGSWSVMSDRNAKTNVSAVNTQEILRRVVELPIQTWSYKEQPCVRHLGPMAQDFAAAFKVGANDTHITTVDADGVALAAIQGLNQKLEETVERQAAQIETLKQSLAELTALTKRLAVQAGLLDANGPKAIPESP